MFFSPFYPNSILTKIFIGRGEFREAPLPSETWMKILKIIGILKVTNAQKDPSPHLDPILH
jgi:hypothetical protein